MPIIDLITFFLLIFLGYRGYSRGFTRSLLGPLALIIASVAGYTYYVGTKNILIALCIMLVGPFILGIFFKFFLKSWKMLTNPDGQLNMLSRLGGALLTLAWGMFMWIYTLILLLMILPPNKPFEAIYNNLHGSITCKTIKTLSPTPATPEESVESKESIEESIKSLSEDKRLQEIRNDPQILEAANNKNYSALLSNPKVMALVQNVAKDPKLLKRMLSVSKSIQSEQKSSTSEPQTSQ